MKKDYAYDEPSDYEGILAKLPERRHTFALPDPEKDYDALYNTFYGAWTGRVAGCLLGKPVEGAPRCGIREILDDTHNYPMSRYMKVCEMSEEHCRKYDRAHSTAAWADRITNGIFPGDDDTNYTVLNLRIMEMGKGYDITPGDVMRGWLNYLPFLSCCTAERVAYRNAAAGLEPPETATYKNAYREWIGAQIRADFYGYAAIGDPHKAAQLAWCDGSISHIKNGIYGEMYCAAMIAAAGVTKDIMTIIEAGMDEIPATSRLRHWLDLSLDWYREGIDLETFIDRVHENFNEGNSHDWTHTIPNAMIVTMALLYGEGDYTKSICAAVTPGFDTDCNGATVGSILGIRNGFGEIPEEWYKVFEKGIRTSVQGYDFMTVDELTRKTIEMLKRRR